MISRLTILLELVDLPVLHIFGVETGFDGRLQFIQIVGVFTGESVLRVEFMLELNTLIVNLIQLGLSVYDSSTDFSILLVNISVQIADVLCVLLAA